MTGSTFLSVTNSDQLSLSQNSSTFGTSPTTTTSAILAQNTPKRKLILHFDQHNTIQVACTLPGRSLTVEEGLNNFLTAAVWGYTHEETSEWQWLSEEPSINKPPGQPNAISFFKYLEKKIVKCPDDRAELKKRTCEFVYNEPGEKFREFFELYLESLIYEPRWVHDISIMAEETASEMINNELSNFIDKTKLPPNTIPAGDPGNRSLYHLILPDFFDMMRRFQREKREFTIILRTMGIESKNFLDTIRSVFEHKHKNFPDLQPVHVNPNIGQIRRSANDGIELEMDGQVYDTDEGIYEKLCSLEGVNAIRDDFAYWQKNNYECYSAKPLWINLLDTRHHHIIFDDNIRLDSVDDCIANIRLLNSSVREYANVDFDYYNIFDKSSIIQPNLIHLLNPLQKADSTKSYYYEKVKKAERVYDKILECQHMLNIQTKSDLDSSNGKLVDSFKKLDMTGEVNAANFGDKISPASESIQIKSDVNTTRPEATAEAVSNSTTNEKQQDEKEKTVPAMLDSNETSTVVKKPDQQVDTTSQATEADSAAAAAKSAAVSKRRAKIKLERCLSKEDEMKIDKDDTTISTVCSIQ